MIKVAVADNEKLMAESIKSLVEEDSDLKVVGCAGNGLEAFELCKEFSPQIILMDIGMPVCSGIEAARRIKCELPDIKVILLTTFEDGRSLVEAAKSGAEGYLLKEVTPEKLRAEIRKVVSHNRG